MRPIVSSRCLTRMRMTPVRGEVWLFDLGMVEKVRPVLIVSAGFGDLDRALVTVVPHTTSLRGSQFEVVVPLPFLKPGAFLVQNVATYPTVRAIRRLGVLKKEQIEIVGAGLLQWLGYSLPLPPTS
jgi:mRNA interferase MazF